VISVLTLAFALIGLAALAAPELLFDASAGVSTTTLPWGETILVAEEEDAALLPLVLLAQLGALIYATAAVIIQYRRGKRRRAVLLGIGVGWFVGTVVVDILVSTDVIDFVFLSDLGFLGFVVAMSLEAADRTIATERELQALQSGLEEQIARRTASLEAAQHELVVKAVEEAAVTERTRLAGELHDAVTQLLFSINLIAGSLGRLWRTDPEAGQRTTDELQRLTRGALAEMRVLLRELRPHAITETDLGTLLTQLSDGVGARYDIPAEVNSEISQGLPEEVHFALYRIAQEAVNNVAKHADASRLTIDLTDDEGVVRLAVVDDGVGFEASDPVDGNLGLRIMRERAETIGADLAVSSGLKAGTSVTVSWTPRPESHDR
jgi:signal transduction histidine kinase